jgi:hypothetical protein
MALYRTHELVGYMHADAPELDRKLRDGDGIFWTGDPRLYLAMGIVQANRRMWVEELGRYVNPGEVVARSYEVWRHGEDGREHLIGRWRVEEFDRILMDLAPMRLDSPGHKDTLDEIDKHNAKLEKAASDQMKEALAEGLEHQLKLWHDRTQPKNVFRGLPGLRKDDAERSGDAVRTAQEGE